jgi:molybdopterin molybdotransferase
MPDAKKLSSCDDHDPNSLSVEQARARIIQSMQPVAGIERLAVRSALDRVLAEDVISPIDVPSHTNSAMDGYAIVGSDIPQQETVTLTVIGTAFAGAPLQQTINKGQCARIMTGAKMPAGADTVIMQEHVERTGDEITLSTGHKPGQNVRQAGEDLAQGDCVFSAGQRLTPAHIGMLASMGFAEVAVHRRVRVAFFSTGDELRSVGEPLDEGQIYDSNRYTLYGMLTRLGVELLDMGVIPDRREAIETAFATAAAVADVLITSGGVSVGEADYVKETLEKIGKVDFWKIAMKPGRPLAFGHIDACHFFGLPGNPVSAMVTFYQFVQPALLAMMGLSDHEPLLLQLPCVSDLRKAPGRVEFQRGIMESDSEGRLTVRSTGRQGSGMLSSMGTANCFIILPQEAARVEAGSLVTVQPFAGLV